MSNSQYWKEMLISTNDESNFQDIISTDQPIYKEKIKVLYSLCHSAQYEEIISFIEKNNHTISGNVTLLSQSLMQSFRQLNSKFLLATDCQNNKMVGFLLAIPLTIKVKDKYIVHGLTSFLCIHQALRKLGLAMQVIRKMTNIGYEQNIYCGYFVAPKSIGNNSFLISNWYRPLKIDKLEAIGFLPVAQNKRRQRLHYRPTWNNNYSINQVSDELASSSLEYYLELTKNKIFVYQPKIDEWSNWIKSFSTYIVKNKHNTIEGIFSIGTINIKSKETILKFDNLLLIAGQSSTLILQAVIYTSSADVLYGYLCGSLSKEIVEKNKCLIGKQQLYFNLYNNAIKISVNDIMVPIW